MKPDEYSFTRYLRAKRSIDDRSLNRHVWDTMATAISSGSMDAPLRVIEVGAGIGTMLARMVEWELFRFAEYTGIDNQVENIQFARVYLREWASRNEFQVAESQKGFLMMGKNSKVQVNFYCADLFDYININQSQDFDLLVAHAFLDLVPLPETINQLFGWGKKDFLYYFSINYDGLTVFEPIIEAEFDELVLSLYHDTMRERFANGHRYGDHQAGRHMLDYIPKQGGSIHSAGSSDWIVYPGPDGYPTDEAYFLHFIIHTIYQALIDHPQLDSLRFTQWIEMRHQQIERAELVYLAHQMDYFGKNKSA